MLMVRKIVLSIAAILTVCGFAAAQNLSVSGTVTATDGSPIAGATVVVEGTSIGTSTDIRGHYTLTAPAHAKLAVSFLGYEDQVLPVNNKTVINVVLKESAHGIDDIIVTAFGTAKKEAFTGSAKVIKAEELTKTQSSNVTDALVGKIAGVQFTSASGRPGSGQTLTIRGYGSINAGNNPLWVVDGVPYDGDINNINAADIESITVQKDAASNALYGARGANGVVMVTTKRAKVGEAHVTIDAKWGVNARGLQKYDIIEDPGEFYELHYKGLYNKYTLRDGLSANAAYVAANNLLTSTQAGGLGYNVFTVPAGQNLIGTNGRLNPLAKHGRVVNFKGQDYMLKADNWLDEIYKSSFRQEYNASVAGATDRSNFYASFGYLDNNGIIDGSKAERYTARLRADYQAKKWLKMGANMSYTHFKWLNGNDPEDEGESDGGNAFATAISMAPIYPVYIRDGQGNIMRDKYGMKLYDTGDGRNGGALRTNGGMSNDLQDLQLNKYIREGNAFSGNGFVDINIYDGLKVTINGGVMVDETRSTTALNPFYGQFAESGGLIQKEHGRTIEYNLQQLISYNETFADVHTLDLLVGHEMYNRKVYGLSASKTKMFSADNLELSSAVIDGANSGSSMSEYNNEGYFFRGQYSYDNRVFVSGSYRRDASSKFHPDHRWGNFWSVSAAWLINNESWFNADWVNLLKIKASYGSQGNDNISSYLYTDYYSIENDGNGGVTTVFARKGNPNITWETNSNLNVGVEFGFWNNRLSGSVEFFNRKTTDMLFDLPTPTEAGYTSFYTNVGDMVNRGIEIELNADLIRTKNVVWDLSLNMTHYKNKVTKLPEEYKLNTSCDGTTQGLYKSGSAYFRSEGKSYFTFYVPTYAGVDPNTGKSLWYTYKDVTDAHGSKIGTERVTTDNYSTASQYGREFHGDALPKLYGGFNTSVRFYGVDLSATFTYQIGGKVIDSGYQMYMAVPSGTSTGFTYHRDQWKAWSAENTTSNIPSFTYADANVNGTSDRFLTDASYLSIQNITLGYTLPKRITRKFLVDSLRIYLTCDNVWFFSKRQGLDTRQSFTGGSNPYYYAPIRTFSGGVTITF